MPDSTAFTETLESADANRPDVGARDDDGVGIDGIEGSEGV
jgi:hypothetical protein